MNNKLETDTIILGNINQNLNMDTPQFCNYAQWNDVLSTLVHEYMLQLPNRKDFQLYELLRQMYSGTIDHAEARRFLSFPFTFDLVPWYRYIEKAYPLLSHVGIDVPTYFNYQAGRKKIVIVAIDPYRSIDSNSLTIGTPYGLHENRKIVYWRLIEKLAEKHTLYLTDTFKLFFRSGNKVSNRILDFTNPEIKGLPGIHQEIFKQEMDLVKPDLIVTMGKIPRLWFTHLKHGKYSFKELKENSMQPSHSLFPALHYENYPVLPLLHLSATAARHRKSNYNIGETETLIKAYHDWVEEKLQCINTTKMACV